MASCILLGVNKNQSVRSRICLKKSWPHKPITVYTHCPSKSPYKMAGGLFNFEMCSVYQCFIGLQVIKSNINNYIILKRCRIQRTRCIKYSQNGQPVGLGQSSFYIPLLINKITELWLKHIYWDIFLQINSTLPHTTHKHHNKISNLKM